MRRMSSLLALALVLGLSPSACSSTTTNTDSGGTSGSGGGSGGTVSGGAGGSLGGGTGGSLSGGSAGDSGSTIDAQSDGPSLCEQAFCPNGVAPGCCSCMQLKCTKEFDACRCVQDCRDVSECLRNCGGSGGCEQVCYQQHAQGAQLYGPFFTCAQTNCATECF